MALTITFTLRKRHAFILGGMAAVGLVAWLATHQQAYSFADPFAQANVFPEDLPPACGRFINAGSRTLPAPPESTALLARIAAGLPQEQQARLPPLRVHIGDPGDNEVTSCVTASGTIILSAASLAPDDRFGDGIQAALLAHELARVVQGTAGQGVIPPDDATASEEAALVLAPAMKADQLARELLRAAEMNHAALYGYLADQYGKRIHNGNGLAEHAWRTRLKAVWVEEDAHFDDPMPKEAARVLERLSGGPKT